MEVVGVAEEEASLVVVPAVAGNDKSKQKCQYMNFTKSDQIKVEEAIKSIELTTSEKLFLPFSTRVTLPSLTLQTRPPCRTFSALYRPWLY